ncbi:MAG: extracellular solute-binding protein [Firmicutes bacterium]|nr:extracellular solute-binding protein [Bacillota bacterium]
MRRWLVLAATFLFLAVSIPAGVLTQKALTERPPLGLSPYHPVSLYFRLLKVEVHPFTKLDPQASHTITLWETRWPLFWSTGKYDDFLRHMIRRFQETYPNVQVEYVFYRIGDVGTALEHAPAGDLPDVYAGPAESIWAVKDYLIPVTSFVGKSGIPDFEPAALDAVREGRELWAWPRWIESVPWVANAELLKSSGVDPAVILQQGWTRRDVIAFVEKFNQTSKGGPRAWNPASPMVLDASDTGPLRQLLASAGKPSPVTPEGGLAWQGKELADAVRFLDDLRKAGAFPKNTAPMAQRMLELLWEEDAALLVPSHPGLVRHVVERRSRIALGNLKGAKDIDTVFLPPPQADTGSSLSPVTNTSVIAVLRKPRPARDDSQGEGAAKPKKTRQEAREEREYQLAHERLAVEFARFMSRGDAAWLPARLKTVPAFVRDRAHWAEWSELPPELSTFLIDAVGSGPVASSGTPPGEAPGKPSAISPGKVSRDLTGKRGVPSPGSTARGTADGLEAKQEGKEKGKQGIPALSKFERISLERQVIEEAVAPTWKEFWAEPLSPEEFEGRLQDRARAVIAAWHHEREKTPAGTPQ